MNATTRILFGLAIAASTVSAAEERVDIGSLPAAVQKTLEQRRAEGPIKQVTRQTIEGRTVYVVEIEKNNALNPRLRIAEDGTLFTTSVPIIAPVGDGLPVVAGEAGGGVAPVFPKISLTDLPAAVQRTAQAEAAGREIVDIDRETWRGRPVYEIEFKQSGLNSRVYIDDSGAVVRDERRPTDALRSLFMGTQLSDMPAVVQDTVRRIAGTNEIADIDRKTVGKQTVYRVAIRRGEGIQELRVAEDGKVIYDSHAALEQRRGL
jgi:uncharacterized membrane protein YkoI